MSHWIASMRAGQYAAAWVLAEQELNERNPAQSDDPALPYHLRWVWDGSDYRGKRCLIRCYHGLGDTIQFARFLPLFQEQAGSVTVEVQPPLLKLLKQSMLGTGDPAMVFRPFDQARPLPRSECDIEITELDFALRAAPNEVPVPYLKVGESILPRGAVGLCYGAGDWNASRSIAPSLFAPLCVGTRCLTLMPEPTTLPVINPKGCPYDIESTAALVAGTSLVITVDTMIAHLAGAMGKPVWLLLNAKPDWRWPTESGRTPWYPSMRIYPQEGESGWEPVVERVRRDLVIRYAEVMEG